MTKILNFATIRLIFLFRKNFTELFFTIFDKNGKHIFKGFYQHGLFANRNINVNRNILGKNFSTTSVFYTLNVIILYTYKKLLWFLKFMK